MTDFLRLFSYAFVWRALIAGLLIALAASLIGISLVLKRYSMIGDGLSHVGFGTVAAGLAFGWAPVYVAFPSVLIAAFLLLRLSGKNGVKGDSAIALVSSSALALGIIAVSVSTGMNVDIYNYMFGSILTLGKDDLILSAVVSVCVVVLFVLFYNRIFAVTFDSDFAAAGGMRVSVYNMLIALLAAMIVVTGLKMAGALLISSLLIFPPLTSMRLFKSYKKVVICSAAVSAVCYLLGFAASAVLSTPTGATVVAANLAAFLCFWLIEKLKNVSAKKASEKNAPKKAV